jgi:hypothetical protein
MADAIDDAALRLAWKRGMSARRGEQNPFIAPHLARAWEDGYRAVVDQWARLCNLRA